MKHFKTWAEFAEKYSLVLFNNVADFPEVMEEYAENHYQHCEFVIARVKLEELENSEDKKDIAERKQLINDYGEDPHCQCEVFQWYAIAVSELDVEYLNEEYNMDIFYSDHLGIYILPVYHFGTSWDYVNFN